jgi:GNAT superfamily N-acetyltransferase
MTKWARLKKNRATGWQPGTAGPVTAESLTSGWRGPAGTMLRITRPGEAAAVAQLAETTGGPLDEYMHAAIENGTGAAALLKGLHTGKETLLMPAARAGAARDPAPLTELSLALVAARGQQITGALYALPPGAVIAQMMAGGIDVPHALFVAATVIKIKAVATSPAYRGHGIASALLDGCVRLYDQLGYQLQYGSFATGSGLETFYTARGFDVLPPGAGVSLDGLLGVPTGIGSVPGEQMFTRWR